VARGPTFNYFVLPVDVPDQVSAGSRASKNVEFYRVNRLFLSKIRPDLGGLDRNGADVCNVVAFLEGWDRVDVQDDTGDGSAGFEYDFTEIVGDKPDFHSLLNIVTTLHKRVPNARTLGQDIHDSVEPDGILDEPRLT
jgi:hypothetical protein